MGIQLWLIRHGETEWSAAGKHTSRTDIPLTDKGRERAVVLGESLAARRFCAVFCSPMSRARETCRLAGFGDLAVVDADLCEWDYGVYEGCTTRETQREIPGWSVWTHAIENGESLEQVGVRADRMIAKAVAAAEAAGGSCDVALFGHAHILRILAARWIGLQPDGGALLALSTGSVSVLGWEREARVLQQWNLGFEG